MWAVLVEVFSTSKEHGLICVLLAFCWETFVDMVLAFERAQQHLPRFAALSGLHESVRVADHDQRVPCTREQDGQALRRRHEPDIMARIAPRKRDYHDVAFFPLVVVYARCA